MNYQETTEYLFNSTPVFEKIGAKAYKEGLYNTHELDRHFDHPHKKFKTIHVAGTNGKGSCSHTLASILQHAGYKVGLYTSPHLIDFRERIKINGKCISEKYVVEFVENERGFFEKLHPSFFELTTAMAFKYFADNNVDIAVIEVGLGGRLDCTNIINPIISVITNISFDHTQFLGSTLPLIAGEKAGIIKEKTPVVIGEDIPLTRPVFEQKAKLCESEITFAGDTNKIISATHNNNTGIVYKTTDYGTITSELYGDYQQRNANTILHVADILLRIGVLKDKACVVQGFADVCDTTGLMGRWQKLQDKPLIVCDTGHNVGGWQYLSKQIKRQHCQTLRIVFGMVDDKDIEHVMQLLPPNAVYYFTRANTHRAIPEDVVRQRALKHGLKGLSYSNVADAYRHAIKEANTNDFIFIGGSSYIVADLLAMLEKHN